MKDFGARLPRPRPAHPYAWLWEPLAEEPRFVLRAMFGAKAAYLDGRIVLCFCHGEEPWRGVLVPTDRAYHAALQAQFPELTVHSVLGKWLYLPETADTFERTAATLVALARQRDARIGVLPAPRKRRTKLTPARGAKTAARPKARRKRA
jgi:hypothetical protein